MLPFLFVTIPYEYHIYCMAYPKEDVEKTIDDILYDAVCDEFVIEREPWALDRVKRCLAKLQTARLGRKRFKVVIPWLSVFTAFTAPGKHIFISRSLFQKCPTDEMVAFIIAHEIAHHDLRHIKVFPSWLRSLSFKEIGWLLLGLYRTVEMRIYGPELECDADLYALKLCIKAGYDADECLRAFDVLEQYSLDMGDVTGVYGSNASDETHLEETTWTTRLRVWLFQRKRGYLPIVERRQALLDWLQSNPE